MAFNMPLSILNVIKIICNSTKIFQLVAYTIILSCFKYFIFLYHILSSWRVSTMHYYNYNSIFTGSQNHSWLGLRLHADPIGAE